MSGPHRRAPWCATDPEEIVVHTRYAEMKGVFRRSEKDSKPKEDRYQKAKRKFDAAAALEIADEFLSEAKLDKIAEAVVAANMPALVVYPNPEFHPGVEGVEFDPGKPLTNAIPAAVAAAVSDYLGGEVDQEIVQVARPGRTNLSLVQRLLWQPTFDGMVRRDKAYIIVDDVCSRGGTIAALRHHIVSNGGTVTAVTTLANTEGQDVPLPIAPNTLGVLKGSYGPELNPLFRQEVGHEIECLTELEGAGLADWYRLNCLGAGISPIQRLRDRFAKAKEKGS